MDNIICAETVRDALLTHGFDSVDVIERYNPASPRIIAKVNAGGTTLIVKGIPDTVEESIITGNTSSHRFLGQRGLAPALIPFPDGKDYICERGFWFYMFEYVDGELLTNSVKDEKALGELARRLHSLEGYTRKTWFDGDIAPYRGKYRDKPWASEYDSVLDSLPELRGTAQCFTHSDIGPHNAMRDRNDTVVFIDLDDSGVGCRYIDVGFPFIMQFVTGQKSGEYGYDFDAACAFLRGYYDGAPVPRDEYDMIWHGAVFMQISYLDVFGPDAVDGMWRILKFGLTQKEMLWKRITEDEVS